MGTFIETDEQYHSGFEVNEYAGKWSLISARTWTGRDGDERVSQKWGEIEIGKDKTKRLPVSVELGKDPQQAINYLMLAIDMIKKMAGPQRESYAARDNRPLPDDSDVPF